LNGRLIEIPYVNLEIRLVTNCGSNPKRTAPFNTLPEHDYVPLYKDQKGVDFRFYQTLSTNPKYVTDDGCELIGSLYFKLTEGMSAKNEMTLKINVSGTELVALVTEKATGKKSKGYFRLLKEYGGDEK
jgi:hypothetical protein